MKVLKYLNDLSLEGGCGKALETLTEELGIKVTYNEKYNLYVLNYSQINSPKTHPIVTECRSLVLSIDEAKSSFYVVSRSFDRFLNLGENGNEKKIDITKMKAYEKLDGSLVGLFFHKGEWLYRTKSMIMPDIEMYADAFGNTWKDLIEGVLFLETFNITANADMVNCTFILELTSPVNRIVTRYTESKVTLLAIRDKNGAYLTQDTNTFCAKLSGWETPISYKFDTIEDCKRTAEELPNLEEGYVLYDEHGVPQCKVKSPTYLAIHRLRGESIPTPKRIMDLVFTKEVDEYLAYFPEDTHLFTPYIWAFQELCSDYTEKEEKFSDIEDQKEYALAVKEFPFAGLLFQKRKNKNLKFTEMFNKLSNNAKYKMVTKYLKKEIN